MSELIKREISLTVLRIRLVDCEPVPGSQAPPVGRKISCELEVTGDAQERGLAPNLPSQAPQYSNRRSSSNRRPQPYEMPEAASAAQPRGLAQWTIAPAELQLPEQYAAAVKFNDKPGFFDSWLGNLARWAVTAATNYRVLDQSTVDGLERFADGVPWLPSGSPMLPSGMVRQLQMLLSSVMRDGDCLWIEIVEPIGYLPLLPWEEMLRPATPAPILRLSPHDVKSTSGKRGLSVALCVTAPSATWVPAPETLASLTKSMLASLPVESTLHIFPDDLCHAQFRSARLSPGHADSLGRTIKLYEPPDEKPEKQTEEQLGDPWRMWIGESLRGTAVDIFHCIAPALFYPDNVWLLIARRPRCGQKKKQRGTSSAVGRPVRYVTSSELSELVTAFGAWGVIFSTPQRGPWLTQSRLGLRLLVDRIGRIRPVAIAFHDAALDTDNTAVAETYAFLIGDPSIKASTNTAISLYCHPSRALSVSSEPASLPPELLQQYTKIKQVFEGMAASGQPVPGWMAATQRVVEQAVSRASVVGAQGANEDAVRGVASALKYIDKMLVDRATTQAQAVEAKQIAEKGSGSG